jgi:predicted CxxxxCH...CXXCH cytochrome family protein
MTGQIVRIIIAVALCLQLPIAALALDPPHAAGNGYNCSTCHTLQLTLGGAGYNNICLSCHRPGVPKGGARPFTPADYANPLNTDATPRPGTVYQTSHNWNGADFVPAAGALPPLSPSLLNTKTPGMLACSRCHNPHDQTNPPYLRVANDRDQLCLDCHRVWNTTDHTAGTHPVNFNYTGASSLVRSRPAEYNNPPLNANPANPTSDLGHYLKGGTLLCTTCHGVHYADSNSATIDNPSGYYSLTPSEGYLLRTDRRGATPAALNICSNCHKKVSHTGGGQNVQCGDCHGAHVVTVDGSAPNVFLVKRYMNISTPAGAVRNRQVLFQYTSAAARSYKRADGTGVCQACHEVPTGGNYPPQHALVQASAADCNVCHAHGNQAGAFSAAGGACNSCHGYPPAPAAPGYTAVDETLTPHVTHAGGGINYAFACDQCHKGNSHQSGTFQDVFKDKSGIIAGAAAVYNGAARSCSTVYCHSNGAPRGAAAAYKTVSWATGKGTIIGTASECAQCHEALPSTNVHGKHLSRGYGCVTCHAATVSGNTVIADRSKHADGVKTVAFNGADPMAVGTAWNEAGATCSAGRCHGDGRGGAPVTQPNWLNAATGACGSCHAAAPATYAHNAHFTTAYGPALGTAVAACQKCHAYTTDTAASHVNGIIDLVTVGDCTPCHPTGSAAVWRGTTRLACTSCHAATPSVINGLAAPYKGSFTATGHGQAAAAYNSSRQCESCHNAGSPHITGVLGDNKRLTLANDNTLCASCHNDPAKVPTPARQNVTSHVTTKGGAATSDCKLCHDIHGTTNLAMVRTTIGGIAVTFANLSSGFVKTTAPYNGLCQVCHTATAHYRSGQAPDGHPTKNCLTCHSHQGAFAFQPVGGGACDSCHGYPPVPAGFATGAGNYVSGKVEDYPGGGGAHVVARHVPKTAQASEGWANCAVCHGNGTLNPATHRMSLPVTPSKITIDVQDSRKFNHTLPLGSGQYSGVLQDGGTNATGSCFNVSCHFKGSKKWSTTK